jgi:hypothetical protein
MHDLRRRLERLEDADSAFIRLIKVVWAEDDQEPTPWPVIRLRWGDATDAQL